MIEFLICDEISGLPIDLVDLGCATGEYYRHGWFSSYKGIDLNPVKEFLPKDVEFIQGDYFDKKFDSLYSNVAGFVSLFCCLVGSFFICLLI